MKVLWFSNTPCMGGEYLNNKEVGGGWLKSLDNAIQEELELHIVFYYSKIQQHFTYKKTQYYPIFKKNIYINLLKGIFYFNVNDQEDIEIYLEIINEIKPDLIHIHGTENPFGCIIGRTNIPVVVSIQGNISVIHHKFNAGLEMKYIKAINKKISLKSFLIGIRPFYRTFKIFEKLKEIEKRNLVNCKYVIGRTDWDRRIISVMAPKSHYYYCGEILRDLFYQKNWESHKRENLVIHTTSGNSPYKGFETICKSLSLLKRIICNVEWRIAGIAKDDLIVKIALKMFGKDYPFNELILLGELDENQLIQNMMDADIYVMPSHIENSPNSLCEAMILGMPCIATFAGGTNSILKENEEGILIQDGDPWALAGAIIELSKNKHLAVKYGKAARKTALERHNKDGVVEAILKSYATIINQNQ